MRYTIGYDFGSLSVRGVLMELDTGYVQFSATFDYPHGIMSDALPNGVPLEPDWALQLPADYLQGLHYVTQRILEQSGVNPEQIVGICIDTTACTMLPTTAEGTPLCDLEQFASNPHAYVKLWKHHAAHPYTEEIEQLAAARKETWFGRIGGKVSSEHYLAKCLEIAYKAPELYETAERLIQIGDWLVWKLTGQETRGYCTAAFKTFYDQQTGDISKAFLKELHPLLENLSEKQPGQVVPDGGVAGYLTDEAARWLGLCSGTVVAPAATDAHVTVHGCHVNRPNDMVMIVGTSACQIMMGKDYKEFPGLNGIAESALIPGMAVFEGGQSCVGDMFAWFVEHCVPATYVERAEAEQKSVHTLLTDLAARLSPGESGVIALDWWNGVRSTLMDFDLSGLIVGLSLDTPPEAVYRALLEATAFGLRRILQTMMENGLKVESLYATGGIAKKNPLLMQIYADVCNCDIQIVEENHTSALGSAILAAAAVLYGSSGPDHLHELLEKYRQPIKTIYHPNADAAAVYRELYEMYCELYVHFGTETSLMKRLRKMRKKR